MTENDQEAARLGDAAQRVLDNPAWEYAFDTILEGLAVERRKAATTPQQAEYMRMVEIGVCKAKLVLEQTMQAGRFVKESIRQEDERKRWWNRAA